MGFKAFFFGHNQGIAVLLTCCCSSPAFSRQDRRRILNRLRGPWIRTHNSLIECTTKAGILLLDEFNGFPSRLRGPWIRPAAGLPLSPTDC